ncbi:hypothetical protein PGH42_08840 [Legionella pneumophila]|nr:hypothetical protein PGH42_08840 [Legionella pneumophila]
MTEPRISQVINPFAKPLPIKRLANNPPTRRPPNTPPHLLLLAFCVNEEVLCVLLDEKRLL